MEDFIIGIITISLSLGLLVGIILGMVVLLRKGREKARREGDYWRTRLEWACQAPDFIEPTYCARCERPIDPERVYCDPCAHVILLINYGQEMSA